MAKVSLLTPHTLICLLLLAIAIGCVSSARILDEAGLPIQIADASTQSGPTGTLPSGQLLDATVADPPLPDASDATVAPVAASTNDEAEDPPIPDTPVTAVVPTAGPVPTLPGGPAPITTAAASAVVAKPGTAQPQLSFFMHDIIGGSHPSARVVTGVIANSEISAVPFSKPNNNIFPMNGGVPIVNGVGNINGIGNLNGIINNNNLPFLTGLSSAQASTVIQNAGNNDHVAGGNNQPFVTAGQLPAGATLQQLMFGSITVFDDELTEGHELGSAVIGKAQGFYLANLLDGTSQTIAVTVMLHSSASGDHEIEDTISFFAVHRTASPESQVAIVGGTGKYEHAKGYTTVETFHQENQHITDGVDTILQFSVYLSE
ncbi:dirigent protein 9 [Syzygium oleosum]|uniref:dirigent protein 9 n=1 Tax=Syzygium oleosum TaxID=219896 RepID=UPI0011D24619|nr:dirigent protein 9 [Syzygium oleosum]